MKLLNDLAKEVSVKAVRLKATSTKVEAFVRLLDARCQTGDRPGRLRAAVALYMDNGGKFAAAVLPFWRRSLPVRVLLTLPLPRVV